jgi:sugar O-acyltransferase (sialic acid O-acetyltransferase NeuD family)
MSIRGSNTNSSAGIRGLLIVGTGGFARETAEAARAINEREESWALEGFLDDAPKMHGKTVNGLPVLGPAELAHEMPQAAVVIATGRPDNYVSRRAIADRLALDSDRFATIVHPTGAIGPSCRVGPGSVLLAHTTLTADVVIGSHVAVMPQVVIPHDAVIGDFVTMASGARIGGSCQVDEGAYIGSAACLRQGILVGRWALVGMGSVVTQDVPEGRMWHGVPARDEGPAPIPGGQPPARLSAGGSSD